LLRASRAARILGLVLLGIIPSQAGAQRQVAAPPPAVAHFQKAGATVRSPVQDVGEGIRVASVTDPFGNVVGLIENPHFVAR